LPRNPTDVSRALQHAGSARNGQRAWTRPTAGDLGRSKGDSLRVILCSRPAPRTSYFGKDELATLCTAALRKSKTATAIRVCRVYRPLKQAKTDDPWSALTPKFLIVGGGPKGSSRWPDAIRWNWRVLAWKRNFAVLIPPPRVSSRQSQSLLPHLDRRSLSHAQAAWTRLGVEVLGGSAVENIDGWVGYRVARGVRGAHCVLGSGRQGLPGCQSGSGETDRRVARGSIRTKRSGSHECLAIGDTHCRAGMERPVRPGGGTRTGRQEGRRRCRPVNQLRRCNAGRGRARFNSTRVRCHHGRKAAVR